MLNVKSIKVTKGVAKEDIWGGGGHVIHFGNWRVARDTD